MKDSQIIIGTYKICQNQSFDKRYESFKYYTKIEVEPCDVDVYRFYNDACYKVSGRIIADDTDSQIGKIDQTVAQHYAYNMIKDINFTPNEQFFIEFPHLSN